ncbi:hypothetical protein TI39_contig586g00007 [Zymoseptoria brevis]|uniref:Uncharacterized protein n=1 Tax=Zymoseptoria brevis TaxID=1047168 RepID=A0A0F4GIF1_9PEZI|nr:hypothetical protein TI39_contig586g00007 [Zymoseptoria brevis]
MTTLILINTAKMARVTRRNPTGETRRATGEGQGATQLPVTGVQRTRGRGKKAEQNPAVPEPEDEDEDPVEVNPKRTRCGAKKNSAVKPKGNTTKATSGKRNAAPENEDELAAEQPRKVKKTSKKTADAPPLQYNSEQATSCAIVVECEVKGHDTHECVTQIDANFFLKAPGATKQKPIGEIVTYLIDMSAGEGEQSKRGQWVSELLRPKGEDEVQLIFQTIFTKTGAVKKKFVDRTAELTNENLLFIHTFALSHPEAYGGTGIAQDAMNVFMAALPNLPEPWAYSGAIVLSPAADEQVKAARVIAGRWTDDVQAEAGLIVSWKKSGFEVWLRGNPKTENSVTIMGRS